MLHGGLGADDRRAALARFTSGDARVLLTTDAAGEGLNLHHRCRLVINVELPWNPNRLEQRIGRVDRLGQTRTVHAIHLVAADTAEEPMLARLTGRIAQIAATLGDAPAVLRAARAFRLRSDCRLAHARGAIVLDCCRRLPRDACRAARSPQRPSTSPFSFSVFEPCAHERGASVVTVRRARQPHAAIRCLRSTNAHR